MMRAYQRMKRLLRKHDATARSAVIVVKHSGASGTSHPTPKVSLPHWFIFQYDYASKLVKIFQYDYAKGQ